MRVCVIGAGVVGVTTAYELSLAGHDVVLVDAGSDVAKGSSFANGGQLSYSYVAPLAGPGVLPSVPSWLIRSDSPLRFRPRFSWHQWRWLTAFVMACRGTVSNASTAALLELSELSRAVLHATVEQEALSFDWAKTGKLIVYRDRAQFAKAEKLVAYQATKGSSQRLLNAEETIAIEPALAKLSDHIAGAIFTPTEESGDCQKFTAGLAARLAARENVSIQLNTEVKTLEKRNGVIHKIKTSQGDLHADAFVVASGMGSRHLLSPVGHDVPLYALKGYSFTLPLSACRGGVPTISVTDYQRRIVYARLGDEVRIAGMVDMGSEGSATDKQRQDMLIAQVRELFPEWDFSAAKRWTGLRPATPKGLPMIGKSPAAANLWVNLGQGALGFTLACGSARVLSTLMSEQRPPINVAPFTP